MEEAHRSFALPAPQVGAHHIGLQWPGPDQCNLDGQVGEGARLEVGDKVGLCPAFHLEDADRLAAGQHRVDLVIVWVQCGKVQTPARELLDDGDGVLDGREHTQPQDIDFDDTGALQGILVPLHHRAIGHGRGLQRDQCGEGRAGEDHPAVVNAQMPGNALQLRRQPQQLLERRSAEIRPKFTHHTFSFADALFIVDIQVAGEALDQCGRKAQYAGYVPHGGFRPEGHQRAGHGGVIAPVALVDVLDDLLTPVGGEVDVDIGWAGTLRRQEAFENEVNGNGVNGRDIEQVSHQRVSRAAPSLAAYALCAGEVHDIAHDQEVVCQVQLADDAEFLLQEVARWVGRISRVHCLFAKMAQVSLGRAAVRCLKGRQDLVPATQKGRSRGTALGDVDCGCRRFGHIGEEFCHRRRGSEMIFIVGSQTVSGLIQRRVQPDTGKYIVDLPLLGRQVVNVARGHDAQVQMPGQFPKIANQVGFARVVVALNLNEEMLAPEDPRVVPGRRECLVAFPGQKRSGHNALATS